MAPRRKRATTTKEARDFKIRLPEDIRDRVEAKAETTGLANEQKSSSTNWPTIRASKNSVNWPTKSATWEICSHAMVRESNGWICRSNCLRR